MAKNNDSHINTGGGVYIGGSVDTGGGKFVGRDDYSQSGLDGDEVGRLFDTIFAKVDQQPRLGRDEKADLKAEIDDLRKELGKKGQVDETFMMRRLRNIGRMAPEILDVTLAAIVSPAAGFGMVAKKIADKFKASAT